MHKESRTLYQKTRERLSRQSIRLSWLPSTRLTFPEKYVLAFLFVAVATLLRWLLEQSFGDRYPYILFGPPVLLAALLGGIGPGLVATVLSAFAATCLFPGPHGSFSEALATTLFCAYGVLITLYVEQFRRARAEEIRREGEEHLRSLYESSLDGILLTRPGTGEIVTANPAALSMFGMTMEEIVRAGRAGVVVDDLALMKGLEGRSRHARWRGDLTLRRKDGSTFPAELSSSFFTGRDGTIMSSMSIRDITERKDAERRLRESEAMLAHAQQMAHVGHWNRDFSTGRAYWSDETYRIFGLDPQTCDVHGSFLFDHIHPDDRERVERAIRDAAKGVKPYEEIFRPVRPDGSIRWVHARGEVIRTLEGKPIRIFGTVLDITERRQMEEELRKARDGLELRVKERTKELTSAYQALRQSEEKYKDLYDQANDIIFTTDLEGRITSANQKAMELFSRGPTVTGIPLLGEILTPEGYDHAVGLMSRGVAENSSLSDEQPWEFEARTNEGGTVILEVKARLIRKDGVITGFQCIARDITQRKRLEEERAKLSSAVERAGEGIFMLTLGRRFSYVNTTLCNLFGFRREEFLGQTTTVTRSDRYDDSFYESLWRSVESGEAWSGRQTRKRKDGTAVEADITITPIRDGSGAVTHYLGVVRDIGPQLQLEEQLRQSQKMEAVGTLAGGVAHDFNNILAITLGNAELAQEDMGDTDAVKRNLEQIVTASKRGKELVRQILTFSRKTEQRPAYVHLIPLVQEICTLMRASIPTAIVMDLQLESSSDIIFADSADVQQVLMNLINNAAYAMRQKGGRLVIRLSDVVFAPGDPFPDSDIGPGRYLKLIIMDTGTGMTADVQKRIFEPFFTTKEVGQGTGMGLALVYAIVKNCRGAVTVESRQGKGSLFSVFFPLSQGATISETKQADMVRGGTEHILFVDDEEPITLLARVMLERLGYRVTARTDPVEAWRLFQEQPFDLVITDQTMPETTGLALAEKMLKVRKEVPVILCTGYSETVSADHAKKAGVRAFLMKPITKKELADTIRWVLDGRTKNA